MRNPQAVNVLKSMQKGDKVLIYHSQGEGVIRGLAEVLGNGRPDLRDEKSWLVDFKFVRKFSEPFVSIKEVKASGKFYSFALVRQGRLSTMAVPEEFVKWLKQKGLNI